MGDNPGFPDLSQGHGILRQRIAREQAEHTAHNEKSRNDKDLVTNTGRVITNPQLLRESSLACISNARGRSVVFHDYRLRIAGVIRDYGMFDREQAPTDSRAFRDQQ